MAASFDVAIVGAGPAGAWTARSLATRGAQVAVIDGSHPREKPCGGGLSARALRLLQLPPERLSSSVIVRRGRFAAAGESADISLDRPESAEPALVVVSRRELDGLLLEQAVDAGAIHIARRVVDIAREKGGWRLTTDTSRLDADWVIGADGANSLVRRKVNRAFPRDQLSIASGHFVHGASDTHIDVEFTRTPPGYLWAFPRKDHLAVGVCGQADETTSAALFDASSRWIRARCRASNHLTRYSWPIPSLTAAGLALETPAGDRWILVGDAAGLVDPITREGIFFALLSGELAADSLAAPDAARRYADAVRSGMHRELRKAARIKARFFGPRFSRLLVQSLGRSDRIARIMADLVAGRQTYDGLRRRLLLTGEWRLLWEYLMLVGRE
jgi:geranylgeranyl reductase family protein